MQVKIIGNGAWGKSIASVLEENSHTVVFLEKGKIRLEANDTVVLALPTNAIREALSVAKNVENLIIVNCSKGIERDTNKLPFEIVKEIMHPSTEYFALLGPSFANEVAEKMPTLVNVGFHGQAKENASAIQNLFQTSYLRIHLVRGVAALELAAALKNIYAIACGLAEGVGFGMNTRTKVIVTAIGEFYRLCRALGFDIDEKAMSGIIGDFILTGSSEESRNFQFGKLVVTNSIEESLKQINATVEGYHSARAIAYLSQKADVTLPLAELVATIVQSQEHDDIKKLFTNVAEKI